MPPMHTKTSVPPPARGATSTTIPMSAIKHQYARLLGSLQKVTTRKHVCAETPVVVVVVVVAAAAVDVVAVVAVVSECAFSVCMSTTRTMQTVTETNLHGPVPVH